AGGFVGELNLLTGQNVYLLCRVREGGTVYRVSPERLRQLMANDVELSDIVFKALIARRELLQRSTAALAVEIVGADRSAAALALRTYAARQRLIHLWFDADTPAGRAMMQTSGLTEDDLPAVVMPGATLKQATPGGLAERLGLSYRRSSTKPVDVTIVGAGRGQLSDRELFRLPVRPFRCRSDRPGRAPGTEVWCPASQPLPSGQARH